MTTPLDLWQILRPVLDEYVIEAVSGMDDPDFEWEADHIDCLKDYADVVEALANQLAPPDEHEPPCGEGEPWPTAYQLISDGRWEQRQAIRQRLLTEVIEVRKLIEESFNP